jgi:hypothetical protein
MDCMLGRYFISSAFQTIFANVLIYHYESDEIVSKTIFTWFCNRHFMCLFSGYVFSGGAALGAVNYP